MSERLGEVETQLLPHGLGERAAPQGVAGTLRRLLDHLLQLLRVDLETIGAARRLVGEGVAQARGHDLAAALDDTLGERGPGGVVHESGAATASTTRSRKPAARTPYRIR